MIVLKATEEQKDRLEGIHLNGYLQFIQDVDDNWIVGVGVIDNPNFYEIGEELNSLERIENKPKKINI